MFYKECIEITSAYVIKPFIVLTVSNMQRVALVILLYLMTKAIACQSYNVDDSELRAAHSLTITRIALMGKFAPSATTVRLAPNPARETATQTACFRAVHVTV